MQMILNDVEYLGINVENGRLLEEKTYYHWREQTNPLPGALSRFLTPFDMGVRHQGSEWSYSCFIPSAKSDDIAYLLDYCVHEAGFNVPKEDFLQRFYDVAALNQGCHYDPIVSFKYDAQSLKGVSFYVTALKEKDKMNEYMAAVFRSVDFAKKSKDRLFINRMVHAHYADMFQVSWDFSKEGFRHNKVYLKIKQRNSFCEELKKHYPFLSRFIPRAGFRFCELAFVLGPGIRTRFNLYFKPL